MSNSFKNIQNKLQQLKKDITPNEPNRREEVLRYLSIMTQLCRSSYLEESVSDYMYIKTITDSVIESEYFGGFTRQAIERLRIIERRYNYIHEK